MKKGRPRKNDELRKKCAELGIAESSYYARLHKGWTPEEASLIPKMGAAHIINGKTVRSQLTKAQYYAYLRYVGLRYTQEEALSKATAERERYKYERDGISLYEYCKRHKLSYMREYTKARRKNERLSRL